MNAPAQIRHQNAAPDDKGAVYAAINDAMEVAAVYAETAMRFCEIRDARGLAYATRSASAALLTAASMLDELRPSRQGDAA